MTGEERSPRLGWWLGMTDHVLRDGSLGDLNAQFQEFAMNSRRTPERIFPAHGPDQITSLLRNTRTSRSTVTNLPGPEPMKSLTMPADDGFRFDDDQGRSPTRPQA